MKHAEPAAGAAACFFTATGMSETVMANDSIFKGCLLVSDMDGTLIDSSRSIPARNSAAIRAFTRRGGYFVFATGRTPLSAGAFLDRLDINAPCIVCNGAMLYDYTAQKALWSAALPAGFSALIAEVLRQYEDVGVEVITEQAVYVPRVNDITRRHTVNKALHYVFAPLSEVPAQGWNKVIFTLEDARIPSLLAFVRTLQNGGWDFMRSEPTFLEALPQNVSKGTTILRLADHLKVDRRCIFAIGDYYNDAPLFETAAFCGVPAGAPADVRALADVVVGPCEDGAVADFIGLLETRMQSAAR